MALTRARTWLYIAVAAFVVACSTGAPPTSISPQAPSAEPTQPVTTTAAVGAADEPWVAYSWPRQSDRRWAIFLVRADGSDAHQIVTEIAGEQKVPAWSPDGQTLAFVVRNDEFPEGAIWTAKADGTDAHLLSNGGADCPVGLFHPGWSPDGTKLAVVCYPGGDEESIAVMDLATMSFRRLATYRPPDHLDNAPTWSPDGATLAFDIQHWDATGEKLDGDVVATVPVNGGVVQRLTKADAFMAHADWSPDGRLLAMNSYDLGNIAQTAQPSNVYTMRPDGTGLSQLTHSSVDGSMRIGQPHWDPDGSRIIVSIALAPPPEFAIHDVHVGFVDANGGEPVLISQAEAKYPDVAPTP